MRTLKLSDLPPELRAKIKRSPRGAAANSLPNTWLEVSAHGLLLMERRGESGADKCLALISTETLEELRRGREVRRLTEEEA